MMWRLGKEFRFEASHVLPNHKGKCSRLHGHSWRGTVYVQGNYLQEKGSSSGMVVDYADISSHLKPLIETYLDHYHLNDTLGTENPTSEVVAQWVYRKLKESGLPVSGVEICETCTSKCYYTEVGGNLLME